MTLVFFALATFLPNGARAGPPFRTDDPVPTDMDHWEIYSPFLEVDGQGNEFEGATGVELNYGAARESSAEADIRSIPAPAIVTTGPAELL